MTTSKPCGGSSNSCGIAGSSCKTTNRCRTIRASARRCPITRLRKAIARSTIRRSSCAFVCVTIRSTSFLAWTTTPWTLPANMALAVHPDVSYCVVERRRETHRRGAAVAQGFRDEPIVVLEKKRGKAFAGMRYQPLFDYCKAPEDRYFVIPAPFVTTEDGTGVVHVAPAYGPDDLALGQSTQASYLL